MSRIEVEYETPPPSSVWLAQSMTSYIVRASALVLSMAGLVLLLRASSGGTVRHDWLWDHPAGVIATLASLPLLVCVASTACAIYSRGIDRVFNSLLAFVAFKGAAIVVGLVLLLRE